MIEELIQSILDIEPGYEIAVSYYIKIDQRQFEVEVYKWHLADMNLVANSIKPTIGEALLSVLEKIQNKGNENEE